MKKKLIKISKIFLVLTLIFSQLSSITKVLADEITNDDILVNNIENIEEETNALAVDGYLNYLEDESLMSLIGIKDGNSFKYTVGAKVYTQILTISGDDIDDNTLYSVTVNEKDSIKMTGSVLKNAKLEGTITDLTNSFNTIIKYTDKVEITEVQNTETTESTETQTTEKEPIVLEYNAVLVYEEQGNSFDEALTNLYDGVFESDLYQWVPVESKSLEDENISFTPVDEASTTIKTQWYDSMRELFLDWLLIFADLKLQNGAAFIIITKRDDTKKANKYSVRVMSSAANS